MRASIQRQNKMALPCGLTRKAAPANIHYMAYSFLMFDFGGNEDVAQQARHKADGWRQGFRLDKKLQLKFDRKEAEAKQETPSEPSPEAAKEETKGKAQPKPKSKPGGDDAQKADSNSGPLPDIHVIVRLDFSEHEKLSHQRWLDRIPTEEPFKSAKVKIVRSGDPDYEKISDLFDLLD